MRVINYARERACVFRVGPHIMSEHMRRVRVFSKHDETRPALTDALRTVT